MPLPIAHGLLGASIIAAVHPRPKGGFFIPLLAGALSANAADFDFALVFILGSKSWHRGFTHSVIFALLVCAALLLSLGLRHLRPAIAYGLAFASHGLLDYVTTKEGGGVALLWPFSSGRLVLGLAGLSEVPSRMPPVEVVKSLGLELLLFMPPLLLLLGVRQWVSKRADTTEGAISQRPPHDPNQHGCHSQD